MECTGAFWCFRPELGLEWKGALLFFPKLPGTVGCQCWVPQEGCPNLKLHALGWLRALPTALGRLCNGVLEA